VCAEQVRTVPNLRVSSAGGSRFVRADLTVPVLHLVSREDVPLEEKNYVARCVATFRPQGELSSASVDEKEFHTRARRVHVTIALFTSQARPLGVERSRRLGAFLKRAPYSDGWRALILKFV